MFMCLVLYCFFLTVLFKKFVSPGTYVPLVLATRMNKERKKVTIRQGRRSPEVQKEGRSSERCVCVIFVLFFGVHSNMGMQSHFRCMFFIACVPTTV